MSSPEGIYIYILLTRDSSVQSKIISMRLEKPISALTRLSETLPLKSTVPDILQTRTSQISKYTKVKRNDDFNRTTQNLCMFSGNFFPSQLNDDIKKKKMTTYPVSVICAEKGFSPEYLPVFYVVLLKSPFF